jgi:hypothetical protein
MSTQKQSEFRENLVKKQIAMALMLSAMTYGASAAEFMKPNTEINNAGKHVVINIPQLRLIRV